METTTRERPTLRLVTEASEPVERDAKAVSPLGDAAAEEQIIDCLRAVCSRVDQDGDLRYQVSLLIARFEQRLARRARREAS